MNTKLKQLIISLLNGLARKHIARFKPVVVAVTGSVGKTSAKEAIVAVLSARKRVRGNVGNFNSDYGVPLTILGNFKESDLKPISRDGGGASSGAKMRLFGRAIIVGLLRLAFGSKSRYPEILVLEYAADKPGDLNHLIGIAKPNISVVTAVGEIPVHVEFYPSPEHVAKEKAKIIEALPASGLAVLNGDELRVAVMNQKTRAASLSYGFAEHNDIRIIDFENKIEHRDGMLHPIGITFKLGYDGAFVPVRINGSLGPAQAYAAGAAAAVGLAFNFNLVDISQALAYYKPPAQRMQFLKGKNGTTLIDDSYNASPLSMQSAIETVKDIKAPRKVAIIGDMRELGEFSGQAHKTIGELASKVFDVVIAVGAHATAYAEAAAKSRIAKKNIAYVVQVEDIVEKLPEHLKEGDLVLIKASHSIHLEKAAAALKAE